MQPLKQVFSPNAAVDQALSDQPESREQAAGLSRDDIVAISNVPAGLAAAHGNWLPLSAGYGGRAMPEPWQASGQSGSGPCEVTLSAQAFCEKIDKGEPFSSDCLYVVDSDLELIDSPIKVLPRRLHVKGDFEITDCPELTALPNKLAVAGDLSIDDCPRLELLSGRLWVAGGMLLGRCAGLTAMPGGIRTGGGLCIENCLRLRGLPDNMRVKEDFAVNNCPHLMSLGEGGVVGLDLWIDNCPELRRLPLCLEIGASCLTVAGRTGLDEDAVRARSTIKSPEPMDFDFAGATYNLPRPPAA